jgi:hypothetical protein
MVTARIGFHSVPAGGARGGRSSGQGLACTYESKGFVACTCCLCLASYYTDDDETGFLFPAPAFGPTCQRRDCRSCYETVPCLLLLQVYLFTMDCRFQIQTNKKNSKHRVQASARPRGDISGAHRRLVHMVHILNHHHSF